MDMNKKEALLEAAKELFGEYGYAETTFKKISEKAGVALGLLTHHYGSKEKLFLASGLSVLENFEKFLIEASRNSANGYQGVMKFCAAYLEFSLDASSNWLVLVRCSPYSDMKTKTDRDLMDSRFAS
ncbi:MAG: TetR/AcrR family transcriptional regulator, partial [Desulfovibrio sp.]|nr:TetR/AcrR family transcriptional regulator [Desulfovibrio sp.]